MKKKFLLKLFSYLLGAVVIGTAVLSSDYYVKQNNKKNLVKKEFKEKVAKKNKVVPEEKKEDLEEQKNAEEQEPVKEEKATPEIPKEAPKEPISSPKPVKKPLVKPESKPEPVAPPKIYQLADTTENSFIVLETVYGAQKRKNTVVSYHNYSDGRKEQFNVVETGDPYWYYNSFNASTADLIPEAGRVASNTSNIQREILECTNRFRAEVGAKSLNLDNSLNIVASVRAIELAWSNTFEHQRPSGAEWYTAFKEAGASNLYNLGENLAKNYYSSLDVCNGWRNSKGHYQNMIKPEFGRLGVSFYELHGDTYYVQAFAN